MKTRITFFPMLLLLFALSASAQDFPTDPDRARFVTEDIDRFWAAYDQFWADTSQNPFQELYLDPGTKGVEGFMDGRIQSAEHLRKVVLDRKEDYDQRRERTLQMKSREKRCRAAFYALKYWYPEARYAPVYFVVGVFNSGGTASSEGLMIGAEMQSSLDNVPHIVAHELIHFQQHQYQSRPTLLEQAIHEGSADFLGELISGAHINPDAFAYGEANEEALCREFVKRMDEKDYQDWMYGTSGKDDRPSDLGYWMGYQIAKAYFDRAADKKQAIRDILQMRDARAFLEKSGFLDSYL